MNSFSIGQFVRRPEFGAVLSFVAVIAFYVVFGGVSLGSLFGAASWVNFAANLGIVALPVGLLMIAGELDISIGAMIPAGSMSIAILSGYYDLPIVIGMLGALTFGVLVGLMNGFLAVRTSVPSLIITLGTLVAVQGLVLAGSVLLTGGASVPLDAPAWAKVIFGQLINGKFQVIILWWFALTVVFGFVLHATRYGNWIFAMGGDEVSARNAGIPTKRLKIGLFVLSSTAASFVGMCGAILFNSVAGLGRHELHLQHDRLDCRGRGAAHRRLRFGCRDIPRRADLRCRQPGHLFHRHRPQLVQPHYRRDAHGRRPDEQYLPADGAELRAEEKEVSVHHV
ncbi:simple sugar transport system permease protein [Sinorhizobium fredii]